MRHAVTRDVHKAGTESRHQGVCFGMAGSNLACRAKEDDGEGCCWNKQPGISPARPERSSIHRTLLRQVTWVDCSNSAAVENLSCTENSGSHVRCILEWYFVAFWEKSKNHAWLT
jgi:hypothetical protein